MTGRAQSHRLVLLCSQLLQVCVKKMGLQACGDTLMSMCASVRAAVMFIWVHQWLWPYWKTNRLTRPSPQERDKRGKGSWNVQSELDQNEQPHYHISCCYFPISSLSISLQASWRTVPLSDWSWCHFLSNFCQDFTTQQRWTNMLPWEIIQACRDGFKSGSWGFHFLLPVYPWMVGKRPIFERKMKQDLYTHIHTYIIGKVCCSEMDDEGWYSLNKPTFADNKRKYQMHICFLCCASEKPFPPASLRHVLKVKHNSSISS